MRRSWALVGIPLIVVGAALAHWPHLPLYREVLTASSYRSADTSRNFGYESADHISPILMASYTARRLPSVIGLQFIGDSEANLRQDKFRIKVTGPDKRSSVTAPSVFSDGLVGTRPPTNPMPGLYKVQFQLNGFAMASPNWSITLKPPHQAIPSRTGAVPTLLRSLNTLRSTLHLAPAAWDTSLVQASQAHAYYLQENGFSSPSFHKESQTAPGFTGSSPWSRDMSFGWPTPNAGEVGMEWSSPKETPTMMQDLIDTVFHRISLLSGNLISAGAAMGAGPSGSVVMDLGYGYRANLPLAIVYPFNGQTGVPTSWVDIESPDPMGNGYGRMYGYPITAAFPTVDTLSHVSIRLSAGLRRPAVKVDPPGEGDMGPNQIGVVPLKALKPNTAYTVRMRADALFNDGGRRPINISWRFSTGSADHSVAATVISQSRVVISDVTAGSGIPREGEHLTLYQRSGKGTLKMVEAGTTNEDGLWTMDRKGGKSGYYEAVSQTGNAALFFWGSHG